MSLSTCEVVYNVMFVCWVICITCVILNNWPSSWSLLYLSFASLGIKLLICIRDFRSGWCHNTWLLGCLYMVGRIRPEKEVLDFVRVPFIRDQVLISSLQWRHSSCSYGSTVDNKPRFPVQKLIIEARYFFCLRNLSQTYVNAEFVKGNVYCCWVLGLECLLSVFVM